MNKDLKSLVHWLNATKISFNVTKTEIVIFRAKMVKFLALISNQKCAARNYIRHIM